MKRTPVPLFEELSSGAADMVLGLLHSVRNLMSTFEWWMRTWNKHIAMKLLTAREVLRHVILGFKHSMKKK